MLDPPQDQGVTLPGGVFTKVTWNLGRLEPGTTTQIKYVAGIPLRRNVATWPGGTWWRWGLGSRASSRVTM